MDNLMMFLSNQKEDKPEEPSMEHNYAFIGSYITVDSCFIYDDPIHLVKKDVINVIPKNSMVKCNGYYLESNGIKWLRVTIMHPYQYIDCYVNLNNLKSV